MKTPELSIVIPAKNEEKRIGRTLQEYGEFFSQQDVAVEIIVVVNGTSDNTAEVVRTSRWHTQPGSTLNIWKALWSVPRELLELRLRD